MKKLKPIPSSIIRLIENIIDKFLSGAKWKEIFISNNMEEYLKFRIILEDNNVEYKTKIQSNSLRLASNNITGRGGASLSRGAPAVSDTYYILVKEDEMEKSKRLLG